MVVVNTTLLHQLLDVGTLAIRPPPFCGFFTILLNAEDKKVCLGHDAPAEVAVSLLPIVRFLGVRHIVVGCWLLLEVGWSLCWLAIVAFSSMTVTWRWLSICDVPRWCPQPDCSTSPSWYGS